MKSARSFAKLFFRLTKFSDNDIIPYCTLFLLYSTTGAIPRDWEQKTMTIARS